MSGGGLTRGYDGAFNSGGAMHPSIKAFLKSLSLSFNLPGNYRGMAIVLLRKFDREKSAQLLNVLPAPYKRWDLLDLA
jgi:hypothetical protein